MTLHPIRLTANQPPNRFYAGGQQIAQFRSTKWDSGRVPEDWVGSTTPLFGHSSVGLTTLPSGELLRDAVESDPIAWLGREHIERFGEVTRLPTKLLDAGQRLPVHVHPDTRFSRERLGRHHGKTEAWVILRGGTVYVGFRQRMSRPRLEQLVAERRAEELLETMHAVDTTRGDAVLVPAGLPHAIGQGTFLLEVQEPEDLSILLEWEGFDINGARDGHLGLGYSTALDAVDLTLYSRRDIMGLVSRQASVGPLLPSPAAPFFRVDTVEGACTLSPSFSVLVVTNGAGEIQGPEVDQTFRVRVGDTVLIPHEAGPLDLSDHIQGVWGRPPTP